MSDFNMLMPLGVYGILMFPADVFFTAVEMVNYDCYRFAFGDGFRFCKDRYWHSLFLCFLDLALIIITTISVNQ